VRVKAIRALVGDHAGFASFATIPRSGLVTWWKPLPSGRMATIWELLQAPFSSKAVQRLKAIQPPLGDHAGDC